MTRLPAISLLLRRVRAEAGILLLLFVLVGATSFIFAAAPRLLNRVTDDALRYAARTASPPERDVYLRATGFLTPGSGGGTSAAQAYGELREPEIPASLGRLFSSRAMSVSTVRFAVRKSIVAVTLRSQSGITDAARLVAGHWPEDRGMQLKQRRPGQEVDEDAPPIVFEMALSTSEAEVIDVELGDRLPVTLDISDSLIPPLTFALQPTEIEVVGLFEPLDPSAAEWTDTGLLQPTFKQGQAGVDAIYATGLMAPDAYANLSASQLPFRYEWRYGVDPERLDGDQVAGLRDSLRRLDLIVEPTDQRYLDSVSSVVNLEGVVLSSGMTGILDRFAEQRARSESVLSIAALGPLGLAGAAIGMFAALLVRRRRASLLLARGRGASGTLLLAAQGAEAILLAGAAAAVGLLLAIAAIPARDAPLSLVFAIGVALVTTLLLTLATWPAARRPLIQLERDDPAVVRVAGRRLVIEASIVVLAIVVAVLLRQRGLTLGETGDVVQFDPLLAAVPLLVGLAAGIIAMRIYPLPIRVLGWLAARRRDFVPVIGLRTVARHPAVANLPLLVLMFTAAFAAFASVVASSIERGQVAASYLDVGADYRLEAVGTAGLPASFEPTAIPGVEAAAIGAIDPKAAFVNDRNQRSSIALDAVDTAAYARVTAGTPADPRWPAAFLAQPPAVGVGTAANPIPAIVSALFPPGSTDLGAGAVFDAVVGGQQLKLKLVGRHDPPAGMPAPTNYVVVPLDWVTAALPPDTALRPTLMWLRAPGDVSQPLADALGRVTTATRVVSRQAAYAELHEAPLGTAVSDGFGIAVGVAVLYLAIILVAGVAVASAESTRDLAFLRTLGVSGRQALALTAVEQAPPVLLALVPGVLLGVGVAMLVEPGLSLGQFAGAAGLPLFVDWATLLLVVLAVAVIVVLAIGLGTWFAWRARLVSALRMGES